MVLARPELETFDLPLSMARQVLYRVASLALSDPRSGSWEELWSCASDTLVAGAGDVVRDALRGCPVDLAFAELSPRELDPSAVASRLPRTREAMDHVYESGFGLLASGACPPHETDYIASRQTFQRSHALADVNGFYRAFGLRRSSAHRERPDHIALELEFMAVLIGLERAARESPGDGCDERPAVCRDAQRRFLEEHLAWWAPAFARLLRREHAGGFYEAVGALVSALIGAERALLGVPAPTVTARPSTIEEPEACEGCGGAELDAASGKWPGGPV